VPEFIGPIFAETSPKRTFSIMENERFGLVFAKTGSINSGTDETVDMSSFHEIYSNRENIQIYNNLSDQISFLHSNPSCCGIRHQRFRVSMVRNFQGKPLFPRVFLVVFIYKVCYYDIKEASVLDNFHKETLLNGLVFGPWGN